MSCIIRRESCVCDDDNKRGHNFDTKGRFAVQEAMEYTANTMILRNFSESCKTTHDLVLVVARGHGRGAKVFVAFKCSFAPSTATISYKFRGKLMEYHARRCISEPAYISRFLAFRSSAPHTFIHPFQPRNLRQNAAPLHLGPHQDYAAGASLMLGVLGWD
jgi:hypothetical protein